VATSSLDGISAGEVRISGLVEPIEQTLISPLQSRACVWYRARVETTGDHSRVLFSEEQAQEFRVRNETGEIRVVPRGARWEIGATFDERTDMLGDEPLGLQRRSGAGSAPFLDRDPESMSEVERAVAAEALLTLRQPVSPGADAWDQGGGSFLMSGRREGRRYREARLEPGQTVTIMGQAWPWAEVRETVLAWRPGPNVERDIADDIAFAREMGTLAASPEEAWGNAAIPGFGIGAPTAAPRLDAEADQPEVPADPAAHETALARYRIPDEELVLSRGLGGDLAIYLGSPGEATSHHDFAFVLGLIGAGMAALCAFGLGLMLTGTL
jgi:hypothetical protein